MMAEKTEKFKRIE